MSSHIKKSGSAPLVSVVLPVFNAAPFVAEAIESILSQTLRELELIVVDDASTDGCLTIVRRYAAADSRVVVLENAENRGRAYCDNRGQERARGKYIAKMDADDVALPHRLQTQFDFLEGRPGVILTSSFLQTFGATRTVYTYPVTPEEVRCFLLFNMPVGNPAVFFRRSLLRHQKLRYDEQIGSTFGEDYEWIARVAQVAVIENQPQVLLHYRTFSELQKADVQTLRTTKGNHIRQQLLEQAGFRFSRRELHIHQIAAQYPFAGGDVTLEEIHSWLLNLLEQNKMLHYADPSVLRRVLAERWFWTCYHNFVPTTDSYHEYHRQLLARTFSMALVLKLKFWLKNKVMRHLNH